MRKQPQGTEPSQAAKHSSHASPTAAKRKYLLRFGRVLLPRAKYHSTRKGAKGYARPRIKRLERREREALGGSA